MTQRSDSDLLESAEEQALRELYLERAPEHIETERAWAAVAQRLAPQPADARRIRGLRHWATRPGGRRSGWRAGLGAAAALVALPLLLMGAGIAKERLMALDPGMQRIADERLYQEVNQSQTVNGVTISVTAAYADEGRTVFYYHIQLSPELAQRYQRVDLGSWDFTDSQGNTPSGSGGLGTCAPWDSATRSVACYMIAGPFAAGAAESHIALRLDISRVYLTPAGAGSSAVDGQWRYQFTIPFHHINIGSVEQFFPHLLHLAPTQPQP
jgi:hypothetical protein